MSAWTRFRDRIRQRLRERFPAYADFDPSPTDPTSPSPAPPVPSPPLPPSPGSGEDWFISDGGVYIPQSKLDSTSETYLWKPESDDGSTAVVLLPARYVGNVANLTVKNVAYRCTTRDFDLSNSKAYPNGARDHWRGGKVSGTGSIEVVLKSGAKESSGTLDLSRRQNGTWQLQSAGHGPTIPTEPAIPAGQMILPIHDQHIVFPEWLSPRRVVYYTNSLGESPHESLTPADNVVQAHGIDTYMIVDLYRRDAHSFRIHAAYSLNRVWPYPFPMGREFGSSQNGWQKFLM